MRKNLGTKPFFYPLPVLIIGSYEPFHRTYHVLGEKVGTAFKDGGELK